MIRKREGTPVSGRVIKGLSASCRRKVRFSSTLERSTNKLWGGHCQVPGSAARRLINGKSRRVVCSLNGSPYRQCALIPHGNGSFVLTVNKGTRDELGLEFGVKVNVRLKRDESRYGLPMPEEFQEVLRQDREGNRLFHALTAGRLRTLLYIVGQAKSPDARISRALTILRHLKLNKGRINYKELNTALRNSRR
jgi:hypothetical protein